MFKIYHITGVKIGCTTNTDKRVKEQGFDNYEILEVHEDVYKASDREIELQRQYGYPVDTIPYWKARELRIKNTDRKARIKGGQTVGRMMVESGLIYKAQQKSAEIRKGSKHSDESKELMRKKAIGNTNKPKIAVCVFDKNDKLIGRFASVTEAAKVLGLRQGNVSSALNGKLKTTGGYKFIKA